MRSSQAGSSTAPAGADGLSSGLRILRLTVLCFLVLDTSSLLVPLLGSTSMGPLRPHDLILTPLCMVASAAAMWRRTRLAILFICIIVVLNVVAGPTGSEAHVLLVSAVMVGALANRTQLSMATLGYCAYIAVWRLWITDQGGWEGTVFLLVMSSAGLGVGLLARRLLQVRERNRARVARLAAENAEIAAIERARLADDLQTVVTGGMALIDNELKAAREHPDDVTALRRHLDRIDMACRSTLTELRALLDVLRSSTVESPGRASAEPWLGAWSGSRRVALLGNRWVRACGSVLCALLAARAFTSGWTAGSTVEAGAWLACALAIWRPAVGTALAGLTMAYALTVAPGEPWSALASSLLFFVLAIRSGQRRVFAVLIALVVYIGLIAMAGTPDAVRQTGVAAYLAFLAIPLGLAVRHFMDARAAALAALERLQREQARIGADERGAVARELHDVVAHQLSLTSMLIMGATGLTDPCALREKLNRIRSATETAAEELDTLLRALRGPAHTPSASPLIAPSIAAEAMAARLRDQGFDPLLDIDPRADTLAPTTQRTLTRVLQEATTNILRYAPAGSTCRYWLALDDDDVRLRIVNVVKPGSGTSDFSLGWGLRGIRERIDLSRGTFSAYPDAGLWTVDVSIPRHPLPPVQRESAGQLAAR